MIQMPAGNRKASILPARINCLTLLVEIPSSSAASLVVLMLFIIYNANVYGMFVNQKGIVMPLGKKKNKSDDRESRQTDRRQYKIDKIAAVTEKAKAVASKRKWLVILLVVGLAVFIYIKSKGIL